MALPWNRLLFFFHFNFNVVTLIIQFILSKHFIREKYNNILFLYLICQIK